MTDRGFSVVGLPFLQVSEPADLEPGQPVHRLLDLGAEGGIGSEDGSRLDRPLKEFADNLDVHGGAHRQGVRCAIGKEVPVLRGQRRTGDQVPVAIVHEVIQEEAGRIAEERPGVVPQEDGVAGEGVVIPRVKGQPRASHGPNAIGNPVDRFGVAPKVRIVVNDEPARAIIGACYRLPGSGLGPPHPLDEGDERGLRDGKVIGVIRFNIWMPVLAAQFDAAVDSLRDADGIVLDLRGNFGGVGGMSMGIAGHFLDTTRVIGVMRQRGVELRFVSNPRRVNTRSQAVRPYAGPLALVVDALSISTTEIFVGGLQAMGRARVFGSQTAGQALPAVTERLPNGDILYHAIADFLSPTGQPLEGAGVTPDVPVPLTRQALLAGGDPALDAAIHWTATSATSPTTSKHSP